MLSILASAFTISLAAAVAPGPITAVILAKSYRFKWSGLMVAAGSSLIETCLILLIFFGLARFLQFEMFQLVLGIAGGIILVMLGTMLLRRRKVSLNYTVDLPVSAFKLGVITTLFNPVALIWWATVGTYLILRVSIYGIPGLLGIILAIEIPNFLWYSIISFLFHRYNYRWSAKLNTWLMVFFGLVLIAFGVFFTIESLVSYY